jgi:cutinase
LTVLAPHLTYGLRADEGVEFLAQRIRAVQAKIKARNAAQEAEEAALAAAEIVEREVEEVAQVLA